MPLFRSGHTSRAGTSLSFRTRRSMNGEEEYKIDNNDYNDEERLLGSNSNAPHRPRGFWDVDEDLDYDEDEDADNNNDQAQKKGSKWRFALVGLGIGTLFVIFKLGLMVLTHNGQHSMEPREILYNNGTHFFASTLIYISLDGFRNDYLGRNVTPNLAQFARDGISAQYMNPSFPSITFPNHWTLATGLYPEAHGIVGNEFYDPTFKTSFIHKKSEISSQNRWWSGEPIWATSNRQGRKSGVIMWPGSPVASTAPTYLVDYDRKVSAEQKMDFALNWLDLPLEERPQMISIYIPQIDQKGHGGGPEGGQLNDVLAKIDAAVGYLLQGLENRNIHKHCHVVIVSDHGMAQTHKSRLVFYDDILSKESMSYLREREVWPLLNLRPRDDAPPHATQQIYEELANYTRSTPEPHFQVYLREDVPDRFHYSATDRIAPIVTIPDVGYSIITHNDFNITSGKDYRPHGIHGYDNMALEMRAIFMARGPRIDHWYNKGTILAPFVNVEVYPFLARIMNLEAAPNNATLAGKLIPL